MKTKHTWGQTHETTLDAHELTTEHADTEESDWLSLQFRRTSIRLYQYWLILNLPIVLYREVFLIHEWCGKTFREGYVSPGTLPAICLVFILYGCCEMLFAINKKRSRIAQRGFVKFQYALICSVIYLGTGGPVYEDLSTLEWLYWLEPVLAIAVHLVGGLAVLKAFQKNHPLARRDSLKISEEENQNFLEQNEAISSELSKYDARLGSWPYLIYKWILKISAVVELIFFLQFALPHLSYILQEGRRDSKVDSFMYPFMIGWTISSLLNAISCFQMEAAMRTRNMTKTKRAFVLLIICTVFSIVKCWFFQKSIDVAWVFNIEGLFWFVWFVYSVLVPIFGLAGAFKVKKLIEERENFVKVSSYSPDTYI